MNQSKHSATVIGLLAFLVAADTTLLHAQTKPAAGTKHCLWHVQGKKSAVYLLGSMHFLKKEFYPLAKPIEEAYQNSQIVMFEADLAEIQTPAVQSKLSKAGQYAAGETLKQNISSKTYAELQTYLKEAVGSGTAFDSLRPWMASVALSEIELQRLGFNPEHGVDNYFFRRAKQDKKEIRGLETVDFQLSLFTGLSKEDQEEMLRQSLEDVVASRKILTEMTGAWQRGDTKKLEKFLLESVADYPEVHKKLLLDRNKQWIAKIERLLDSGRNAFVVVGAAHLIGKESVVDLLGKKGFKVRQM